jgi:hypothetical protein
VPLAGSALACKTPSPPALDADIASIVAIAAGPNTSSSGTDNIDLPCEHAAATWWFEPLTDPATGKPRREETIEFTIYF